MAVARADDSARHGRVSLLVSYHSGKMEKSINKTNFLQDNVNNIYDDRAVDKTENTAQFI